MKFDEAIEKAKKDLVYDDNAWGVWTELLEDLKQEYAPTVEMTKSQLDEIACFKSMFPTRALADIIYNGQDGEFTYLDELSGHLWGHRQQGATNKNIEDTMKAYLYPELVKVVDE